MAHTLERFCQDCRTALDADDGDGGREVVRANPGRLLTNQDFAAADCGPGAGRGARGTLKYRCPAAAFDLDSHERRIFTQTPWGSLSRRRGYNRRSAMERINARLDRSFNFETHYIRGRARMKTRVGLALAVMMAMALVQARAGRAEQMRALVGAVPYRDTG